MTARWTPRPGDLVPVYGTLDGTRYAVVLATSRHKRTYDVVAAHDDLHRAYASEGDTLDMTARVRWFRHTQRVLEDGCFGSDVCEPGSWCVDGDGHAICDVLYGTPLPGEATT